MGPWAVLSRHLHAAPRSSPARRPASHPSTTPPAETVLRASASCTESWRHDSHLFNLELNNFTSLNDKYEENFKKCPIKSEWTWLKQMFHSYRIMIRGSLHKTWGGEGFKLPWNSPPDGEHQSTETSPASDNQALYPPCKHLKVVGKIFWKRKRDVL